LGLERLGDEIVGPDLRGSLTVERLERACEEDDGHRPKRRLRPQRGAHIVPVHVRHDKVQQHQVRARLLRLANRLFAAPCLGKDKIFLAKRQLHHLLDRYAIVRDQDSSAHRILPGQSHSPFSLGQQRDRLPRRKEL